MKMKKGIIAITSIVIGAVTGAGITAKQLVKMTEKQKSNSDKHLELYLLMNQWVRVRQENKSIARYLERNGYREIAVYGMNYVGETLLKELADSDVKIKYGIDRNAANLYSEINIVNPDKELREVDAVIVTAITFFDEIKEMLSTKLDCPILNMEDILYEV